MVGTVILRSGPLIGISLQPAQTAYAIAMGLLGSSLFLLYNLIGAIPEHRFKAADVGRNLARLFVGPVAGWLSYFMYVSWRWGGSPGDTQGTKVIAGTTQIWLPFVAGFSADVMVGIINQGVRAIKYTLGLEKENEGTIKSARQDS